MENLINIKQYTRLEKIGYGASADVFKIENNKTKKIFSAKILRELMEKNNLKNFSREITILPSLDHPAILKFYGISKFNFDNIENPVIITEYCSNGSLSDILKLESSGTSLKEWDDTRKLITIYGIASALSFLHNNKIVHRDLKPSNILMDDFLCPKVGDFGLSKILHSNPDTITEDSLSGFKGTPMYLAPECYDDSKNNYSEASDVYSFALIVYEITTLKKPFEGYNIYQIWSKLKKGFRPQIDYVPNESYQKLIQNCWVQNPCERPKFSQILSMLESESDNDFITDLVDQDVYFSYVNYIKDYSSSFDSKKYTVDIGEFIQQKNKSFHRIRIVKIDDESMIYPIDMFNELEEDCKNYVREAMCDQEIQYFVGKSLIEGKNKFPKNTEIGLKYLKSSLKKGSINATTYLSRLLIEGKVVSKDLKKAKKYLSKILDSKDATALYLYAKILRKETNYDEALHFFNEASKRGNGEAMYEYGKMLYKGEGCKQNLKEAQKYFDLSKNNGCGKSDAFLSKHSKEKFIPILNDSDNPEDLYKCGINLLEEGNKEKAINYLKIAADKGHLDAMDRYGMLLLEENCIHDEKEKAISYFKNAADKGHVDAMNHYAFLLLNKEKLEMNKDENEEEEEEESMEPQDYDEINKYLKNAADNDNIKAMYNLGLQYVYGRGFPVDKKKGCHYFKIAADKGHIDSMYNYALLLCQNGHNAEDDDDDDKLYDLKEAAKYFKMAADKGDTNSMFCYAKMLENGFGIDSNKKEAFQYYKKASHNKHIESMLCCTRMLEDDDGFSVDKEEDSDYLIMADNLEKEE